MCVCVCVCVLSVAGQAWRARAQCPSRRGAGASESDMKAPWRTGLANQTSLRQAFVLQLAQECYDAAQFRYSWSLRPHPARSVLCPGGLFRTRW